MAIELTCKQQEAADRAIRSVRTRQPLFRIGGYAGTGKTSLAHVIVDSISGAAVCAYTGKASSVLRSKGLTTAQTIHKTIYRYDAEREEFVLKKRDELNASYFLLDEASMIGRQQWDDMRGFGLPIIAIGDPGQLEPIGEDPRLMHDADIVLTEIHRQDADSTIIQFATHIRNGGQIRKGTKGDVQISGAGLFWDSLDWADMLLCGFNRTRVEVNTQIRKRRFGTTAIDLHPGDRIACKKNDRVLGVNNGELFTVQGVYDGGDSWHCSLLNCDGEEIVADVMKEAFAQENPDRKMWRKRGVMYADYGYCLSVHSFQGSEDKKIAVISQQCKLWCPVRWSYTAATRASDSLRFSI